MIIRSTEDLQKYYQWLERQEYIAYDLETTGLNPRKDKVIGVGVSNEKEAFYFVHLEWTGEELIEVLPFSAVKEAIEALKSKKLIGHNFSFDARFTLGYFSVDLIDSIYADSMLAKHTVDEEFPFGLKDIAKKLYGADATDEQEKMKESIKANGGSQNEFFKADTKLMALYCMQDCMLTYRIFFHYLAELRAQGLESFFFRDEVMPLYKEVTIPMEWRGIPVDVELLEFAKAEIDIDIDKIESEIQDDLEPLLDRFRQWYLWKELPPKKTGEFAQYMCQYAELELPKTPSGKYSLSAKALDELEPSIYKDYLSAHAYLPESIVNDIQMLWWADQPEKYMFNLSSKDHLKRLFFEKLEEEPVSKTDKGSPQVNDAFLDIMAQKYGWCSKLREYNKLCKIRGAYVERFLDRQENGIFYPSYMQHRTISGRYGSDLQQLPRPLEVGSDLVKKHVNRIRNMFVAGEGCKLVGADYESLEPHVFAHVSGDEGLKNIFRNGHDFYSTIAIKTEKLEGVSADKNDDNFLKKVDPEKRQKAKAYSLGIPYGMESFKLGYTLGIDQKEAQVLIDDYMKAFPKLKEWIDKSRDQCLTKGFVRSQAGRIRHFPSVPSIWAGHGRYILDPLKIWEMFHKAPKKYEQMRYLRKKVKNALNNACNYQIQSLSASIVNRAAIKLMREFKRQGIDAYVCMQTHDELVVRAPSESSERVAKTVQYIMENNYKVSLDLKAPVEVGNRYGEIK